MTTTSPSNAPRTPVSDKENNEGTRTPYLPSALKLGTPFFRGTKRHTNKVVAHLASKPTNSSEGTDDALSTSQTLEISSLASSDRDYHSTREGDKLLASSTRNGHGKTVAFSSSFQSIDPAPRFSDPGDHFAPAKDDKKTVHVQVNASTIQGHRVSLLPSSERKVPNGPECMDTPGRSVASPVFPDKLPLSSFRSYLSPTKSPTACKTCNGEQSSPVTQANGTLGLSRRKVRFSICLPNDQKESRKLQSHDLDTPLKTFEHNIAVPEDLLFSVDDEEERENSSLCSKDSDMIDAMAADFQKEFAAELKVLESMSSGEMTPPNAEQMDAIASEQIKLLEDKLRKEKASRVKIESSFAEERALLLLQLKEVKSHAELSMQLAQEESKQRVQEERLLLLSKQQDMDSEKECALAEAGRQAASVLEESRKRREEMKQWAQKIQDEHAKEIEAALKSAREDWKRDNKGALSIQKVATAYEFQKEIFSIETELLETLDELEAIKANHEEERMQWELKLSALKKELEVEQENAKNVADNMRREVEIVQIELEMAAKNEKKQVELVADDLHAQVKHLENQLRGFQESAFAAQQEQESMVEQHEKIVSKFQKSLRECQAELKSKTELEELLQRDHMALQSRHKKTLEKVRILEAEKSKLADELEQLQCKVSDIVILQSEKAKLEETVKRFQAVEVGQDDSKPPAVVNATNAIETARTFTKGRPAEKDGELAFPAAKRSETTADNDKISSPNLEKVSNIKLSRASAFERVQVEPVRSGRVNPVAMSISKGETDAKKDTSLLSIPTQMTLTEKNTVREEPSQCENSKLSKSVIPAPSSSKSVDEKPSGRRVSSLMAPTASRRSSVVAPSNTRLTQVKTPSVRTRSTSISRVPARSIVVPSARKERNKVKPNIPRVSEMSTKSSTARTGVVTKARTLRQSGLPHRQASNIPSSSVRTKPSPLERTARSRIASGIPRTAQNQAKRAPQTEHKTTGLRRNDRLSLQIAPPKVSVDETRTKIPEGVTPLKTLANSLTPSQGRFLPLCTPKMEQAGEKLSEPSSQQVRDKFSSLMQTWSTAKKPSSRSKSDDLPKSLQLNFDVSATPFVASKKTNKTSSTTLQTPTIVQSFSISDISAGDDEDDELLLSPTPRSANELEKEKASTVNSIVTVQSFVRSFLARSYLRKLKEKRCLTIEKVVVLQSFFRRVAAKRDLNQRQSTAAKQNCSATRIQTAWRMFSARLELLEKKTQAALLRSHNAAAVLITRSFRFFVRKKEARERRMLLDQAQRRAALLMQTQWRRYQSISVLNRLVKENSAVVLLQCWFRSICARKDFRLSIASVVKVQRWFRAKLFSDKFAKLRSGIVILQAAARMKKAFADFVRIRNLICLLQNYIRSRIERCRFVALREKTIRVQTLWRRRAAILVHRQIIEESHRLRKKEAEAAFLIQTTWKARLRMRQVVSAAVVVQAAIRRCIQKKRFDLIKDSVTRVQTQWRRWLATVHKQKADKALLYQNAAAVKIQTWFRGSSTRHSYQISRMCVVRIQAYLRSKWSATRYSKAKSGIALLQSHVRGLVVRKRFHYQKNSAMRIQRAWRIHVTKQTHEFQLKSIITLQSMWRTKHARMKFRTTIVGVSLIQACIRARATLKEFQSHKRAAITLQRLWRGYSVRQVVSKQNSAACVIQSAFRAKLAIFSFKQHRYAATKLQTVFRTTKAQKSYRDQLASIITIQRLIRGKLSREKFRLARKSVTLIQCHTRALQSRIDFQKKKAAIVMLQSVSRRRIALNQVTGLRHEKQVQDIPELGSVGAPETPAQTRKLRRQPLSTLKSGTPKQSAAKQPLQSRLKKSTRKLMGEGLSSRQPLREVSSVFSPARTRGVKRTLALPDQENVGNTKGESPQAKRPKPEDATKPAPVKYPAPEKLKVVELREALKSLGVASRHYSKLRKAQLITMLQQVQEGVEADAVLESLAV